MKRDFVWLQVVALLALFGLLGAGLTKSELGNVAVSARLLRGACVGWVNGVRQKTELAYEWPNWADYNLVARAVAVGASAWRTDDSDSPIATIATFLSEETASEWGVVPAQPHLEPSLTFNDLELDAEQPVSFVAGWHDYGGIISVGGNAIFLSVGIASDTSFGSGLHVEIIGNPRSAFRLQLDARDEPAASGNLALST